MFFFNQSQPWILWRKQTLFLPIRRRIKNKKQTTKLKKNVSSTSDTYVHMHTIYTPRIYYDTSTTLRSVAACSGYTRNRDSVLYCSCCVRVHVRLCTYPVHIIPYYTLQRQTATTAVVVLQLLAFVCCCLPYAIYSSINSSVLLLLDLNCTRVRVQ